MEQYRRLLVERAEQRRRVEEANVQTCGDVRVAGRPLAGFSASLTEEERALKRFLYERLYTRDGITRLLEKTGFRNVRHHGSAESVSDRDQDLGMMARRILLGLFASVMAIVSSLIFVATGNWWVLVAGNALALVVTGTGRHDELVVGPVEDTTGPAEQPASGQHQSGGAQHGNRRRHPHRGVTGGVGDRAEADRLLLRLIPRHALERAGEHDGLARNRTVGGRR